PVAVEVEDGAGFRVAAEDVAAQPGFAHVDRQSRLQVARPREKDAAADSRMIDEHGAPPGRMGRTPAHCRRCLRGRSRSTASPPGVMLAHVCSREWSPFFPKKWRSPCQVLPAARIDPYMAGRGALVNPARSQDTLGLSGTSDDGHTRLLQRGGS